jgi:cytochrome c oxidase subunit 2
MRNARRWSFRAALVFALVILTTLVTASSAFANISGQPSGITDEARKMHDLYLLVLGMAVVVFVVVEAALLFIIFRYRKKSDALPPQTHGNNLLEVVWTTIPIVIVLVLFVASFIVLLDVERDADDEALTIHVEGFQFSWRFTYNMNDLGPGSDPNAEGQFSITGTAAQVPTLVMPVDEEVEFVLTSPDVIHSFYVRDFLFKLDLIPGKTNRFSVTARETGRFEGQCAELCGLNHALMFFHVEIVTREEFDAWVAQNAPAPADNAAAARPR